LNAIFGDNAQGKTNLLEAIGLLSTGRSFRTLHLPELIRQGESYFYLEAEAILAGVTQTLRLFFDGQTKKLQINATAFSTFTPLLGYLPSIFSAPEDIDLVTGSPTLRRRFLNLHLAQSDPLYVHHLSRFVRAMKQRNTLLRSKHSESIDCWEQEMVLSATYLAEARATLLMQMKEPLLKQGKNLSGGKEELELKFHPTFQAPTYTGLLQKSRPREKELGQTLHGPHRDDLSFHLSGKAARTFASEGQKKTIVTALRLAEWDHLALRLGTTPLMAIDDFGGILDPVRSAHLLSHLVSLGQVFLTTPQPNNFGHPIHIKEGAIAPNA